MSKLIDRLTSKTSPTEAGTYGVLNISDQPVRLCDGVTRREAMRIGGSGALGLSLPQLLQAQESSAKTSGSGRAFGRAKSVILFWLSGGPPQHETWDPKPDAPAQIRGEFGAIPTRTPGLSVGELMPKTANLTDRIAVMRAVVSGDNNHSSSGYQMLTGVPHVPLSRENVTAKAPNLWPSWGAIVRTQRPDRGGLPAAITLPRHLANVGEIVWPGQDAGFLARKYDPWLLTCDPSSEDFNIPDLALPDGMTHGRVSNRRSLLQQFDETARRVDQVRSVTRFDRSTEQAFDLLSGGRARQAFDLDQEDDATRDRYGRTKFGQSVLLARRLVEAGVSLIQVNWQKVKGKEEKSSWDIHKDYVPSCKEVLMPVMDQTYSALLEDLEERGMLDDTLVAWIGEFGHTPKINGRAGRDHWGSCFSCALAGAGVRGGIVHGESDGHAAYPVSGTVAPRDIAATVFHTLGYAPETEMHDPFGRPMPITRGHVIHELF